MRNSFVFSKTIRFQAPEPRLGQTNGNSWSRCYPTAHPAEAADGPNTAECSTACSGGSAPDHPGVTCPPSTDTGRRSTTAIVAGQAMEPGNGSLMGCVLDATTTKAPTGPRRSTRPSCATIVRAAGARRDPPRDIAPQRLAPIELSTPARADGRSQSPDRR